MRLPWCAAGFAPFAWAFSVVCRRFSGVRKRAPKCVVFAGQGQLRKVCAVSLTGCFGRPWRRFAQRGWSLFPAPDFARHAWAAAHGFSRGARPARAPKGKPLGNPGLSSGPDRPVAAQAPRGLRTRLTVLRAPARHPHKCCKGGTIGCGWRQVASCRRLRTARRVRLGKERM